MNEHTQEQLHIMSCSSYNKALHNNTSQSNTRQEFYPELSLHKP